MSLSFLKTIKVEDTAPRRGGGGSRKQWFPLLPYAIRVWKDGSVFPSKGLVERFDLEYAARDTETLQVITGGNGFDVFASTDSQQFKSPDTPLVWISPVAKDKPKVDLFGSTGYNEDGAPTSSVLDQGANTFGKNELLPLLKATYGVAPNEEGFIDLVLLGQDEEEANIPFTLPDGKVLGYMPKRVSRGGSKGELTYAKRENPQVFALYPYALLHPEEAKADKAIDDAKARHAKALVGDKEA
jgi:hypothetical protein